MAHDCLGSPTPEHVSDLEAATKHDADSVESRLAAIVSAIDSFAQHAISAANEVSQHPDASDAAPFIMQRDAAMRGFRDAIQFIRSETYRADSRVKEALRMSHTLKNKGCLDGSMSLPGIGRDHEINKLLGLVNIEGRIFYNLTKPDMSMPQIIISQMDGDVTPMASPASIMLPTTKNVKILQHAYGRALRHKADLLKAYTTALGMKNAKSAPKRNKPAHENDSLMVLPQNHRLGTFLDVNMAQSNSMIQKKVEDSELVLAFLLPAGGYQYVEAISGNVKDNAGIGETDLVVPVSDNAIKLLYELYCGLKDCISQRKAAAAAQGLAQARPAEDPTDIALLRRMRRSGLDDDDNNSAGSKRARTSQ
ncbi:hypothetical protein PG985_006572 [Apiospora marii]|uniref:Uncharacterized protein n=1 Tax=Apiospora marii TaxID=335849 RepID=A0ABR1S801_9PEZI